MVGVPGGSSGCNTCRQRKIKCGLQRPQCVQCIKRNLSCSGYRRELKFVHTTSAPAAPTARSKPRTKVVKEIHSTATTQASTPPSTWTDPRKISRSWAVVSAKTGSTISYMTVSPLKSYRQQLLHAYLGTYIPLHKMGPVDEEPWICLLPELLEPTSALEAASMALCTAALGRNAHDPQMITESHRLYTQGLSELQKALWNPRLMYRDETLGACMILAMYELVECPSKTTYAYISHHDGCARLVQLRGSKAHSSGLAHKIFTTFRVQGILRTLETCQPNYLTESEWMHKPWENISKSAADKIMDVLAIAPAILSRVKAMQMLEHGSLISTATQILDHCRRLDSSLLDIYEQLSSSFPGPLYWAQFTKRTDEIDTRATGSDELFSVAFHFSDLRMAKTMMYYWATQTMLWSGISKLSRLLLMLQPDLGDTMSIKLSLDRCDNFISSSRNVCQSIEYCMQDEMLFLGKNVAVAPLMIVAVILEDYPEYEKERNWIRFKLKELCESGVGILSHHPTYVRPQS